jgi:hypothetical protein
LSRRDAKTDLALSTMENHSILALDLLYELWKLLFELATAKMHGACYVSIITTLVIPTTRYWSDLSTLKKAPGHWN